MSIQMTVTERRWREGSGEKYLATDPTRVRCQAVSKTKLKMIRIREGDPTLTSDDCWPEAQCPKAAEPQMYACKLHGGVSSLAPLKQGMADYMPMDMQEKLAVFEQNRSALVNRTNEIKQLLARNAQLYESLDELVLGEEAYLAVAEAVKALDRSEIQEARLLLTIALQDTLTEKEVWREMRENTKLIDKLTITHFNIEKELKLMTPIDQMKNLLEGLYRGAERIFQEVVPDPRMRIEAMRMFAALIRQQANIRQGVLQDVD